MPQLIALALIGGVVWFAYRALKREMARVGSETRDAERGDKRKVDALEKGPDGVYRPRPGKPETDS